MITKLPLRCAPNAPSLSTQVITVKNKSHAIVSTHVMESPLQYHVSPRDLGTMDFRCNKYNILLFHRSLPVQQSIGLPAELSDRIRNRHQERNLRNCPNRQSRYFCYSLYHFSSHPPPRGRLHNLALGGRCMWSHVFERSDQSSAGLRCNRVF
jgi:hypothetical protein